LLSQNRIVTSHALHPLPPRRSSDLDRFRRIPRRGQSQGGRRLDRAAFRPRRSARPHLARSHPQSDQADAVGLIGGGEMQRGPVRSEEHKSELQSHLNLVCRLLLEKKKSTTSLLVTRSSSTKTLRFRSSSSSTASITISHSDSSSSSDVSVNQPSA